MPKPIPVKIGSAADAGSSSAAPRATPMKGPLHGVAITAASRPVPKAPIQSRRDNQLPLSEGPGSSKTPAKLRAMPSARIVRTSIIRGSCNWKDQPISCPIARAAKSTAPRTVVARTLPAA